MESDSKETVSQKDKGDRTSSGGGFSTYYMRPFFQQQAIDEYFNTAINNGHTPAVGFGIGRGYPDISLAGNGFQYYLDGQIRVNEGNSLSASIFAGFISNINAARLSIGKGSLGWINHVLYSNISTFINDITIGNNCCYDHHRCCGEGYYAGPGWDPASGLGSLNYGRFKDVLVGDRKSTRLNSSHRR